ncbi:MAG: 3-isopropylmalate dehydratase small subunit [SAR324 cluster bacterium]|nr:3-isopropylmalate dehydratase small subunit [SAR324 cluster bacterium]
MEPFTALTALALPLDRVNVDTDAIIPKQFLKSIKRTGFGDSLFNDWRYIDANPDRLDREFVLNFPRYQGAGILLTRQNFGCGSSREHAPWALMNYGFRALVGPSFADIFYNNSLMNGLLPAIVAPEGADALFAEVEANEGCKLTVELPAQKVRSPAGLDIPFEITPHAKDKLLQGLDEIALILKHEGEITAFEQQRKQALPWL